MAIANKNVAQKNGHTRVKLVLYFFLFSLCMFTGSAVITLAAINVGVGGSINVIYEAPPHAVLVTGTEFNTALKAPAEKVYTTWDVTVKTITFDYVSDEYSEVIANASHTTVVDVGGVGDIMMYHVGDVTNGFDVYVLCEKLILANENSGYIFSYLVQVTTIELKNFSTSIVKNALRMFADCHSLANLDVSKFDTSNFENTSLMFEECRGLDSLDVTGFETGNLVECRMMFSGCTGLTQLDMSNFDTSNVQYMQQMFMNCTGLVELDLTSWDTSNVTNMTYMFANCSNLVTVSLDTIYLRFWNTGKVQNMSYMFAYCTKLRNISLTSMDTSNVVTMAHMFEGCESLKMLDLSNFDTTMTTDMTSMFENCKSLTEIYVGKGWTNVDNMIGDNMFSGCVSLVGQLGTVWTQSNVDSTYARLDTEAHAGYLSGGATLIQGMKLCVLIKDVSVYTKADTSVKSVTFDYYTEWNGGVCKYVVDGVDVIAGVEGQVVSMPYSISEIMMYRVWTGDECNVYILSADKIYACFTTSCMFTYCEGVESIIFNNWDMSRVIEAGYMFEYCTALQSLDIENWDVSNIININYMFRQCTALKELDLSGWDTSNIILMGAVFMHCENITSINVSTWDTTSATNMGSMFASCYSITNVDVSSFDTSNVDNLGYMFDFCYALESVDLSNFDTAKVERMLYMFRYCEKLTTIYVGAGWSTQSVIASQAMFQYCASLVGGNGTVFDANHTNYTYARVDTAETPGYLTLKNE